VVCIRTLISPPRTVAKLLIRLARSTDDQAAPRTLSLHAHDLT
jgi:hypothetical protein